MKKKIVGIIILATLVFSMMLAGCSQSKSQSRYKG